MEKNLTIWRKIDEHIQSEEFNVKQSQLNNISDLINHRQDSEKVISSVIRLMMDI